MLRAAKKLSCWTWTFLARVEQGDTLPSCFRSHTDMTKGKSLISNSGKLLNTSQLCPLFYKENIEPAMISCFKVFKIIIYVYLHMYVFLPGELVHCLLIQYSRPLYKAEHATNESWLYKQSPTFYHAVICKSRPQNSLLQYYTITALVLGPFSILKCWDGSQSSSLLYEF